jgi:hypothetical protein
MNLIIDVQNRGSFRPQPGIRRAIELEVTAAFMKWANQRRGFQFSQYRAQRWEFVVEIGDAALWLGWLFPWENILAGSLEHP